MPRVFRSYKRAVCAATSAFVVGAGIVLSDAHSPVAHAASVAQLQQEINVGQDRISSLAGALNLVSSRLAHLDSSIASLERQISRIQADLDAKLAELHRTRLELKAARMRLAELEADQARDESVLSQQLVNSYESDPPDIVSVVLSSTGFQDLLERISFAAQIQRQDVLVVRKVRAIRRAVAAEAVRLGALEVREQALTSEILNQRNALVASKVSLVQQRLAVARTRDAKASQLASARSQVSSLQHQLSNLEAAQAAAARVAAAQAAAQSASAASSGGGASGPPPSGGGFVFPLSRGDASPPGSWSPDDGVDISAPGDAIEYAVCSGTIVLHGIGGFGPWAPVLHCDSPVAGYSYVYYGHAGPANQLPIGTHVGAGAVIGSVGPGIVGISTGPHLEIGFCDSSGNPLGPGTAGAMMSLLQSAY
jgi:murein DD-endopeptidase MepM/ murein hydrolase activator NlpD